VAGFRRQVVPTSTARGSPAGPGRAAAGSPPAYSPPPAAPAYGQTSAYSPAPGVQPCAHHPDDAGIGYPGARRTATIGLAIAVTLGAGLTGLIPIIDMAVADREPAMQSATFPQRYGRQAADSPGLVRLR